MDVSSIRQQLQQRNKEKSMTNSFLSSNIIKALNDRINQEEHSSRIYLAMSIWLEDKGYFNAAKLWHKYSGEELVHADWARKHLLSFDIKPVTAPIQAVPNDYDGLPNIIYKTLEHEQLVTQNCKDLAGLCMKEGDYLTFTLAQKYCSEQVEEMQKSYDLVNLLEVYGTEKLNLALLDHELEKFL